MESILIKIQDVVSDYAKIISRISRVDVEIMDSNFYRVAGTGIFKNKINCNMENEGFVYKKTIKTGKTVIVNNPKEDFLCLNCPAKSTCLETFEISTPIKYNDEIIGVIGMVCSDLESKKIITDNLSDYIGLLEQISDFISSKAFEYENTKKLEETISTLEEVSSHIEQGVIIVDSENKLFYINEIAKHQLNMTDNTINKSIKIEQTGDFIEDANEYIITIDEKNYTVIGNIINLTKYNAVKLNKILIFSNIQTIMKRLNSKQPVYTQAIDNIIGNSKNTLKLKSEIKKVANSKSTVLITGESGTGKEMVATAIWKMSDRKDKPFVAVNCGAIPEPLLESELFGYVKGAFTGADKNGRIGKFELANNGIIFLDEIGDMPLYLQVKLLRVFQEREITRLGSNRKIPVDIRVISATNKNLEEMVKQNKFRDDLYYRLNVIPIHITPIRDRVEDIEPLMYNIIERYIKLSGKNFKYIDKETINLLKAYDWPGNVRELENVLEYMINMMEDGILDKHTLPENFTKKSNKENTSDDVLTPFSELEKREIKKALAIYGTDGDAKELIAKKLGIGIATLYRKIKLYDL